jgi:hypothetical protein
MTEHLSFEGEIWVSLEALATCYRVDLTLVEEAFELGLLGRGVHTEGLLVVQVAQLERMATIVRLHVHLGVDLAGIALFLEPT